MLLPVLLVLADSGSVAAQAGSPSCGAYVQSVYSYLYQGDKSPQGDAVELALKRNPNAIAPELRKLLDADLEAAKKHPDEIVGLDFDPFSGSQDPAPHYVIGKTLRQGERCSVEVFAVTSTQRAEVAAVIVELRLSRVGWQITNFKYPAAPDDSGDLVSLLKQMAKDRDQR